MRNILTLSFIITTLAVQSLYGQRSTEMYIPVGKSPGLSGKYTVIGTVNSLDSEARTLTCKDQSGVLYTMTVDENTKFWLDRSALKQSSVKASLMDCKLGVLMEVKYRDNDRKAGGLAEWIKIRVTQ